MSSAGEAAREPPSTTHPLCGCSRWAQLARRLPLVQHGRRAVCELERATDMTAYLAMPCYGDVLVIACSGERGLRAWATLPASTDAAGRVLLAHREPWRQAFAASTAAPALSDAEAAQILERGHALVTSTDDRAGSLAVAIPVQGTPIAALGLRGPSSELTDLEHRLTALLRGAAERVAAAIALTP
jgi:DNA-binding IclR family transcriptional regulator